MTAHVGAVVQSEAAPRAAIARPAQAGLVWGMLLARSVLALGLQVVLAAIAWLGGAADPWRLSADWWLGSLTLVNVATLLLLRALLHREGRRLRDMFRIRRSDIRADLPWVVVVLLFAGPIAMVPSLMLSQALWGSPEAGADLIFRAIPVVAAVGILVVFPALQAAAELPTYFGYVMPRLAALYGWRLRALLVAAVALSAQHMFLPLLIDGPFMLWRAIVFLPLALWLGFAILRRPTTLPYLAVAHGLIDTTLPLMVLLASL